MKKLTSNRSVTRKKLNEIIRADQKSKDDLENDLSQRLEELRPKKSQQSTLNTELSTLQAESKSFKYKIDSLNKLMDTKLNSLEGIGAWNRFMTCFNSDCNELIVAEKIHDTISDFGTVLLTQNSSTLILPNPSENSSRK